MILLYEAIDLMRSIHKNKGLQGFFTITLPDGEQVLNCFMLDTEGNPYKCRICNKEIRDHTPLFSIKLNREIYSYCSKQHQVVDEL